MFIIDTQSVAMNVLRQIHDGLVFAIRRICDLNGRVVVVATAKQRKYLSPTADLNRLELFSTLDAAVAYLTAK